MHNPADWLMFHRADLWEEMLRLATGEKVGVLKEKGDVVGKPAEVRFGVEVIGVDVVSGDVKLASGEVVKSDLVIGTWLRVMGMPIHAMLTTVMLVRSRRHQIDSAPSRRRRFRLPFRSPRKHHPSRLYSPT